MHVSSNPIIQVLLNHLLPIIIHTLVLVLFILALLVKLIIYDILGACVQLLQHCLIILVIGDIRDNLRFEQTVGLEGCR
jgi:hypothetical protein